MPRLDLRGAGEHSHSLVNGKFGQAPAHLTHSARRPKGYMLATGPLGVEDEGETLQCTHCGKHWKIVPGSGRQRGFCLNCNGPTCGKEACETKCVPAEKMIEEMEGRRRLTGALHRLRDK